VWYARKLRSLGLRSSVEHLIDDEDDNDDDEDDDDEIESL